MADTGISPYSVLASFFCLFLLCSFIVECSLYSLLPICSFFDVCVCFSGPKGPSCFCFSSPLSFKGSLVTVLRALRLRDASPHRKEGCLLASFFFHFFFLGVFVHATIEVAEEYTAEPHRSLFLSLPMTFERRQTDPVES